MTRFQNSLAFARQLDRKDPLKRFRALFSIPKVAGKKSIYLCGNSLGLQPKTAATYVQQELRDWATWGVEGHFHAKRPWLYYHRLAKKGLAQLVGAKTTEVVAMNQLTVNLHLMMISFYRPTRERFKILTERGAFSSDQYAFESQLRWHGYNPDQALIELEPRPGEHQLRTEDILAAIHQHSSELALVIFGGVQYYTGQFFKLREITAAAHAAGAYCGFDLAHAIGNVPLTLHRDGVDFAVWCSYKYLNAGPGSIAGAFVHEKHALNFSLPRLAGWWGHDEKARFKMEKGFTPMPGVDGWQLSNVPVLSTAACLASLEIFAAAGVKRLRQKSVLLTGFLEFLLRQIDPKGRHFLVLTPSAAEERGCQLSLYMYTRGREVFKKLTRNGVIADWREPGVIRIAPVPLYNSFEDVFRLAEILQKALKNTSRSK
jgi:kynureninase